MILEPMMHITQESNRPFPINNGKLPRKLKKQVRAIERKYQQEYMSRLNTLVDHVKTQHYEKASI